MKIYLDVSCLNRPFDDQGQTRVRLESEATTLILEQCEHGDWQHMASEMSRIEIDAIPDADRRARVQLLLPDQGAMRKLSEPVFKRAESLELLGFKPADAVHLASAETLNVDIFLSCDDRLCRLARRHKAQLKVRLANPVEWLKEISDETDA